MQRFRENPDWLDGKFIFLPKGSMLKVKAKQRERAIRPIVANRKISGGSRSEKGAGESTRVYSVLESDRKRGKLPFRPNPG